MRLSSRARWRRRSCLRRASRWRTWRKPPRMPAVPASSESTVALPAGVALHARPAATFVKTALRFRSRVTVGADGKVADARGGDAELINTQADENRHCLGIRSGLAANVNRDPSCARGMRGRFDE